MEKLNQILESYVAARDEKPGKDQLLGAAFVVVNKDGEPKATRRGGVRVVLSCRR